MTRRSRIDARRPRVRARANANTLALAAMLLTLPGLARAGTATEPAGTVAPRQSPALVSVRDSPGYLPLVDADSAADRLGRRTSAPYVKTPFVGGGASLEHLARALLGALHAGSVDSMLALCVREQEFRDILWPEFPQSRPATGLSWQDAWPVLYGRLNGGSVACVRQHGGHVYTLLRVERAATVNYRNFRLHNAITIVARGDEGNELRLTTVRSIAERKGRFKIYSMAD